MFTFEPREEGFLVTHENGRSVAHVDTQIIGETNDPKLKVQERTSTPIPKEKWAIHFTGFKLTLAELDQLAKELRAYDDKR